MKAGSRILESPWGSTVAGFANVIVSLEVLAGISLIGEFKGLDDSQLPGQVSISSSSNAWLSGASLFSQGVEASGTTPEVLAAVSLLSIIEIDDWISESGCLSFRFCEFKGGILIF
jgi:hypothetical protein